MVSNSEDRLENSEDPASPTDGTKVGFDAKYGSLRVQKVRKRRGTDAGKDKAKEEAAGDANTYIDEKITMIKGVRDGVE